MMKIIDNIKAKAKKLLGISIWLLAVFLLISTVKNLGRVASINTAVQKERDKVERMKAENTRLEAQIAQTQGADFIDKQIRDKLGLVREGEVIVVLPDADTLRKLAPQAQTEENSLPDPNWRKWGKLFF